MKKIIIMAALAAAAAFTSCNKETEAPGNGNEKANVLFSIEQGALSRAEADKVNHDEVIDLEEGHVFFVESNGVIVRHVKIVSGVPGTDEISLTNLRAGNPETIDNVKTSAAKCYVFANIPPTVTLPTITQGATNIKLVTDLLMDLNDLTDTNGGIDNLPQWGEGPVIQPAPLSGDPLKSTVSVYAMGARLQIEKITGVTDGTDDIKGFKLDGIFVNNYYEQMPVSYTLDFADIDNHGSLGSNYTGSSAAYSGLPIFDYAAGTLAVVTGTVAIPDNSADVWAYNIFPTEGVPVADQAASVPHLVLVFSDVQYEDASNVTHTVAGPLYLTVKGMINKSTSAPIDVIEKGNSYTFSNIQFKFSDLTTVPEVETIGAEVTVQMMKWKDTEVKEVI